MLTKTHPPTAWPPIAAVLSKKRHALVGLALLFIAPPLHADTFTTCRDVTQIPQAQCNTLVALYDNTAGDNWTNNTGWKQTDTPCSWYGVTCSGSEVSQISLSSNQLTGPIPSLNTLASLQTLEISGNPLCQDSNANYAGWTEVDEFPTCGNPNITLTSPAHGATSIPISGQVFTWEPDSEASAHRIVISTQADFANFTDTGSGGYCNETTTCLTAAAEGMQNYTALNLSENTTYYWKVRASRNPTFWSEVHSFTTGAAAPKTGCNGDTQLPDNLCEGLTAYYPMNGNANDASVNGLHGTEFGNPTYVDGVVGQALKLTEADDYIGIDKRITLQDDFTTSFWVKLDKKAGSHNMFMNGANSSEYNVFNFSWRGTLEATVNGPIQNSTSQFDLLNDRWNFIVYRNEDSVINGYINNELFHSYDISKVSPNIVIDYLVIGKDQDCLGGCFDSKQSLFGAIDEVTIHNRALTDAEIQSLYNSTKPATTGCNGDTQLPDNLCEGLTAYYPMNGNANDASGNGHDGIVHGATLTEDRFGNHESAYNFDGESDYIKVADAPSLSGFQAITLSAWFYKEELQDTVAGIVTKWFQLNAAETIREQDTYAMYIRNDDNSIHGYTNNNCCEGAIGSFPKEQWVSATFIHTKDEGVKIYVNGQQVGSLNATGAIASSTNPVIIGADNYKGQRIWRFFKGKIDDVRIYNRALTDAEIQSLYNAAPVTSDETVLEDAEDGNTENWSIYYGTDKEGGAAFANVFDDDKNSQVIDFKGNPDSAYRFIKPDGSPLSTENFIARWSMKITESGIGNPHINKTFWKVKTSGSVVYLEYRTGLPLGCNLNSDGHYAICGLGYELRDSQWHNITRDLKADLKAAAPDIELLSVEHVQFNMVGRVDDIQLLNRNDVNFHTISGTITNNGQGVSSKSLSNTGADCQASDSHGNFTCTVPEGWYGSLTPENTNEHYFAPLTRAYSKVSEDITGQDFTVRLIEDGLEDAEDGDTDGWSISANPQGDSAFANVFDSEKDSRVIELTGNSRSTYQFVFPDGSPLSTTNFIARWDVNMATGFGTVFWRVETTGSVIYMEYRLNTPLGCHLSSKSTYAICGVGENMQDNTWYTITRDIKADLKTIAPDIELQWVEFVLVHTAGRVDNIQLLKEMPAIDCTAVTEIPTAQCEALVALYDSTGGDNWTNNDGWKTTDTPCSWFGVSCENGVVTAIDLDDNNLTGTLPDWSALTRLQELLLGHNKITETIPELSSLTNLKVLSLKYNDLTGTIPELSHLSQLTTLWLEGNNLTGSIPDFSGLTSLTGIHLSANQLSGEIPDLSGLTSAHSIYLGDNQLTGSIPDLSRVTNLWNFSVANNQLSGEIPSLASLPKLESFDLTGDNNKLCRNTEADYAGRPEVDAFPLCGTQAPEAVIAVSEPQEQSDGLAVSFDASGSTDSDPDGNITSQIWITSDGQIATGVNPTITFSEPGEQTVTLIITDNTGKTTSVRQTITVAKPLEIFSLTLTKQGTGKGEFHSTAPDTAIDCDIDCQRAKNDYNSDIVVTLQATPAAGSIFTSWSNGCGGTSNPTTVPINRQRYCTATFDLDPAQQQLHRFRIAKIGDGSGRITVKQGRDVITQCSSADCEAKYFPSGTELTLTTNIANDATFVGWSEDCHGTEPSITVTIEHATKCTAELALRPPEPIERRLTVTTVQETVSPSQGTITSNGIECGNGSDDCVENYPHGQQIWLKATPAPHSYFKEWTTDCSGTGTRTTLIMDTDKTCTAIFGSDSDTNANDMVKTFQDEGQLSSGKQLTDTYPPFNNDYRLQEAYRLAENVMTKIEEHIVLTGSWPHQLHGIEWYYPLPSYLYTKSIQVVSGGTNVKQANGIEEYVEGDYLKVEVLLITETGIEEIIPILISPNQEPPESSSTMRRRGHGYCWWWYRPWWWRWRW